MAEPEKLPRLKARAFYTKSGTQVMRRQLSNGSNSRLSWRSSRSVSENGEQTPEDLEDKAKSESNESKQVRSGTPSSSCVCPVRDMYVHHERLIYVHHVQYVKFLEALSTRPAREALCMGKKAIVDIILLRFTSKLAWTDGAWQSTETSRSDPPITPGLDQTLVQYKTLRTRKYGSIPPCPAEAPRPPRTTVRQWWKRRVHW